MDKIGWIASLLLLGVVLANSGCTDDGVPFRLSSDPKVHRERMDSVGDLEGMRVQIMAGFNARMDTFLADVDNKISAVAESVDTLAKSLTGVDMRLSVLEAKVNDAEGLLTRAENMRESRLKKEEWKQ